MKMVVHRHRKSFGSDLMQWKDAELFAMNAGAVISLHSLQTYQLALLDAAVASKVHETPKD